MKRILPYCIILMLFSFTTAQSQSSDFDSNKDSKRYTIYGEELSEWIKKPIPSDENYRYFVGISSKTSSISKSRQDAFIKASVEVVKYLGQRTENYMQTKTATSTIKNTESFEDVGTTMVLLADQTVSTIKLVSVNTIKESDGGYKSYVLVSVEKEALDKALIDTIKTQLENKNQHANDVENYEKANRLIDELKAEDTSLDQK